jgi:hypothetical protein
MAKTEGAAKEALAEEKISVRVDNQAEKVACVPTPVNPAKFNKNAIIPHGCTIEHIQEAMNEFINFISFINGQLNTKAIARFESMLMPANFSSMVGEFMTATIPKFCTTLAKNTYHNGHPDMLPKGMFANDSCQHGIEGIEVKASRYERGWQGHNAEDCWLMVFVFDSNRPKDIGKAPPRPFRFLGVYLGQLTKEDWKFSGRTGNSRRTITASVTPTGFLKMITNWIYYDGTKSPETIALRVKKNLKLKQ